MFDLKEESEQSRKAKMQTIFKLQGKNKNVPDIKVTQSHTNKFLARLIGKSTSVENLSNGCIKSIPMLRFSLEHDFETSNLKTKSLSSSEIFKSVSPAPSRSGSFSRLNGNYKSFVGKLHSTKRETESIAGARYGSLESLERKLNDRGRLMSNNLLSVPSTFATNDLVYQCPYDSKCSSKVKGKSN